MMLKCWSDKSYDRPNFAQLYRSLTEDIQQQPKRGVRRISRDILRRFGESSINLRRKMSRKGRRKSADSTDQLTSSGIPSPDSFDGLTFHNDVELQTHQPLELDKRRKSTKEEKNEHVDPLNKIEEDTLEQYPENEDGSSNSAHRSTRGKTPSDSSNTKETRSPQSQKTANIKISTGVPSTSSKAKMVENHIKHLDGENNSEINPNVSPNDSLNKDQGKEVIDNLQDQGVNDDSSTDLTSHLMNMMDDVLGVDQQRRDSTNYLDSKNLPKSDQHYDHQDFSPSSSTTEGNTLSKMEGGSGQSAKENPIKTDARPKTEQVPPTTPKDESKDCMSTDLEDLSEDSSEA